MCYILNTLQNVQKKWSQSHFDLATVIFIWCIFDDPFIILSLYKYRVSKLMRIIKEIGVHKSISLWHYLNIANFFPHKKILSNGKQRRFYWFDNEPFYFNEILRLLLFFLFNIFCQIAFRAQFLVSFFCRVPVLLIKTRE